MKKLICLMLLCATFTTFTACKSEDESDSLVGTTWTHLVNDGSLIVIEFESENKVSGFLSDQNMNINGSVYYGTYVLSGNQISLTGFVIPIIFMQTGTYSICFSNGTVTGNNMILNYWTEPSAGNGTMTFHKK